jgi:RNA polymerase sigma-70 factor (ECF subfamily)
MDDSTSTKGRRPSSGPSTAAQVAATRTGTGREFAELVEPHRRELQVHCYRMMGSLQDAEDLVQETLLRAWQKRKTFQGRGSFRAWLYQIATFACLNVLAHRARRRLPTTDSPPADPRVPIAPPHLEPIWLEPFPDDLLPSEEFAPHALYDQRESITLAFLAAVQALPPRQRAVLLLCDMLEWRASEVASLLETTTSAVNSALHRARLTCAKLYHRQSSESIRLEVNDPTTRVLLDRYVHAWEAPDLEEFVSLLKEDATFEMPPSPSWYLGRAAIRAIAQQLVLGGQVRWKLLPVRANSNFGYGVYRQEEARGVYVPFGVQVLTIRDGQVATATTFLNPTIFPFFHLPLEIVA